MGRQVVVSATITNQCSRCGRWFNSAKLCDVCAECNNSYRYIRSYDEPSEVIITSEYLQAHPTEIFVFGDNTIRVGKGGAAILRDEPNTYGFITKKLPTADDAGFFKPWEYAEVYVKELAKLIEELKTNKDKTYLVSKLGAGLANRFYIWDQIIQPTLKPILGQYKNVRFLW